MAVELHSVLKDLKPITVGDTFLNRFECLVLELDDFPATETDQVIVMSFSRDGFVPRLTVREFAFLCEPQTGEKFKRSIDRGVSDLGIDPGDERIDLGEILVARRVEKDVEDLFPLFGRLQPSVGNSGSKLIGSDGSLLN